MKVDGIMNNRLGYLHEQTIQSGGRTSADNNRANRDTLSVSKAGRAEAQEQGGVVRRDRHGQIKESPLEHQCRVEKIKVDIENGTYHVSNDLVVDAIIRRLGEEGRG